MIKYYWAKFLYIIGKIDKAVKILKGIDGDNNWKVKLLLARIHNHLKKFEQALDYSNQALKLVSNKLLREEVIKTKIVVMMKLKRYEEAIAFLKEENQDNEFILETIATVNFVSQKWKKAKKNFKKVLKINSKNKEALYGLGFSQYKLEEYEEALECYNEALKLGYDKKDILSGKFLAYLEMGDLDKAEAFLRKLESKYGNTPFYYYFYAKYKYFMGEIEEAYNVLEEMKPYVRNVDLAREVFEKFYAEVKEARN